MEYQNQKWVNATFAASGVLVGWILYTLLNFVAATYDLEARVHNVSVVIMVFSVAVGGTLFLALNRNPKSAAYMHEVVVELGRVTWPTTKDTYRITLVVLLMVLFFGFLLGGLDALWVWLLRFIL